MAQNRLPPLHVRAEFHDDGSVKSNFLRMVDRTITPAERRFADFGKEANRQLSKAISSDLNVAGSLDLGVDELKRAAAAQQQRAVAAREIAQATRLAAAEERDYSQQARQAIAATEALAREEEEAARAARSHAAAAEQVQERLNRQASAVNAAVNATQRHAVANDNLSTSTGAMRTASIQAGQQLQDITISLQSGQRASTVFAQQLPQLAFALSGLESSANKTQARIGKLATFLSGPWGAAVFAATAVLGPYVYRLIESGDAAEDAEKKTISLNAALRSFETATEEATKAIDEYNEAQERSRDNADSAIKTNLALAESQLAVARAKREDLKVELERQAAALREDRPLIFDPEGAQAYQSGVVAAYQYAEARLAANQANIDKLAETAINLRIDDAKRDAEAAIDPIKKINNQYDDMRDKAIAAAAANEKLSRSLTGTLTNIERNRKAALDAQREADRASRRTTERLPDVTMSEVAGLIGAPITSGRRSRARNRAVGGADNSYHLTGQAIDIPLTVNGKPLTKEGIRAALEPAGVVIKELLGPGDRGHDDHFHVAFDTRRAGADKMAKAAEKAARETQKLEQFGARAAERIQRLNERFDEQPRLIDQAAKSARELDTITKGLADRGLLSPEQAEQIAKAAAAIEDSLSRPFRDLVEDSERYFTTNQLILAGREDEARALERIYALQDQVGYVTREQRATILDIVEQERQLNDLLAQRDEIVGAYVSSIRGVRGDLENLLGGGLSGGDFLKGLRRNFQQLQGRLLTENLFGDFLRDLERKVREETGIKTSVDVMTEGVTDAGQAADRLATSLKSVAERIDRLFTGSVGSVSGIAGDPGVTAGSPASLEAMFDQAFGHRVAVNDNASEAIAQNTAETAKASRALEHGVMAMSPQAYIELMAAGVTKPIADTLENAFGLQLGHTLSGALQGHALGGPFGAALGGLRGLAFDYGPDVWGKAFNDKVLGKFDQAFAGFQTGSQIAQLADALGIGLSNTGSQIGGTFGSLVGGPVGSIVGSIAGGIIGKLIGSTKKGRATIGGYGADPTIRITGNSGKLETAAGGAADAVTQGIEQIAEALGGDVDYSAGAVTISLRKKNYRVDTTGTGITKTSKGALDFGQDQEAAIAAAVKDLIQDGVITGLRQSTLNILKAGKDLQQAIEDALAFENVFKELRRYKDPVGAAIDDLNSEFERLIVIFQQAGASAEEYAQLEELYGIKRAEAIEQATSRITASLQDLYSYLTYGDSGLSLRDRRSELVDRYNELSARVEAGDTTAYDDFAQVARELLEVERQLYGSQQAYFDRRDEVAGITKQALDQQQAIIDAASNADSPFSDSGAAASNDNAAIVASVDNLGFKADATNQNLGTLINQNEQLILQNQQLAAQLSAQIQASGGYF